MIHAKPVSNVVRTMFATAGYVSVPSTRKLANLFSVVLAFIATEVGLKRFASIASRMVGNAKKMTRRSVVVASATLLPVHTFVHHARHWMILVPARQALSVVTAFYVLVMYAPVARLVLNAHHKCVATPISEIQINHPCFVTKKVIVTHVYHFLVGGAKMTSTVALEPVNTATSPLSHTNVRLAKALVGLVVLTILNAAKVSVTVRSTLPNVPHVSGTERIVILWIQNAATELGVTTASSSVYALPRTRDAGPKRLVAMVLFAKAAVASALVLVRIAGLTNAVTDWDVVTTTAVIALVCSMIAPLWVVVLTWNAIRPGPVLRAMIVPMAVPIARIVHAPAVHVQTAQASLHLIHTALLRTNGAAWTTIAVANGCSVTLLRSHPHARSATTKTIATVAVE